MTNIVGAVSKLFGLYVLYMAVAGLSALVIFAGYEGAVLLDLIHMGSTNAFWSVCLTLGVVIISIAAVSEASSALLRVRSNARVFGVLTILVLLLGSVVGAYWLAPADHDVTVTGSIQLSQFTDLAVVIPWIGSVVTILVGTFWSAFWTVDPSRLHRWCEKVISLLSREADT